MPLRPPSPSLLIALYVIAAAGLSIESGLRQRDSASGDPGSAGGCGAHGPGAIGSWDPRHPMAQPPLPSVYPP